MGAVTSKPLLPLIQGEEIQLVATAAGVLGSPNFNLMWKSSAGAPEEEIPTEDLYPSIIEPLCSSGTFLIKLDCKATFNKFKSTSDPLTVSCPSGCLAETPLKIFGTPTCYALHSQICIAAIHGMYVDTTLWISLVLASVFFFRGRFRRTRGFVYNSNRFHS